MKPDDLTRVWGTFERVGAALGCAPNTVAYWQRIGHVPAEWQIVANLASGGTLPVDVAGIVARVRAGTRRGGRRRAAADVVASN